MKKIMILMLSLAVLFSFAACDNSTDSSSVTDEYPITNVDYVRSAASEVNTLLFADADPVVDIAGIIANATARNTEVSGETIVITQEYPRGGEVVGTVTLTLSGNYTAAVTTPTATPASLAVTDYRVVSSGLQVVDSTNDYETYSFDITGILQNAPTYTINADGTAVQQSGWLSAATKAYMSLPGQNASFTMDVPVSYTVVNGVQVPKYESKTFSDAEFKSAVAVVASDNDPKGYIAHVAGEYFNGIQGKTAEILAIVNKIAADGTLTAEEATTAGATVSYAVTTPASQENSWKETGTITLTFNGIGTGYAIAHSNDANAKMTGSITFVFAEVSRTGATLPAEATLTDAKYTMAINADFTGMYPVSFETETPFNGTKFSGKAAFDSTNVTDFDGLTATSWGSITGGLATVAGVELTVDASGEIIAL